MFESLVMMSHSWAVTTGIHSVSGPAGDAMGQRSRRRLCSTPPRSPGVGDVVADLDEELAEAEHVGVDVVPDVSVRGWSWLAGIVRCSRGVGGPDRILVGQGVLGLHDQVAAADEWSVVRERVGDGQVGAEQVDERA